MVLEIRTRVIARLNKKKVNNSWKKFLRYLTYLLGNQWVGEYLKEVQ